MTLWFNTVETTGTVWSLFSDVWNIDFPNEKTTRCRHGSDNATFHTSGFSLVAVDVFLYMTPMTGGSHSELHS